MEDDAVLRINDFENEESRSFDKLSTIKKDTKISFEDTLKLKYHKF